MKNMKYNINQRLLVVFSTLLLPLTMLLTGCEKDLPLFDYPDNELNFDLTLNSITGVSDEVSYSFVFAKEGVQKDTAWFTVNTQGFLTDYDRSFELRQVPAGDGLKDAVPGQHYVAFDSEEMKKFLVIPAGAYSVKVPVLVLRDPSLEKEDVHLFFEVKENEYFKQGLPAYRTAKLLITNRLAKPTNWEDHYCSYYFDNYGPVKHRFMIEKTGLPWNEEFIDTLTDNGYIVYLAVKLYKALEAENAERAARGEGPLCEEDGSPITFSYGAFYV